MSPGRLSAPCRGVKDKRARLKRMAIRRRKAIASSGEAVGIASARSASQGALFGPIIRVMYGIGGTKKPPHSLFRGRIIGIEWKIGKGNLSHKHNQGGRHDWSFDGLRNARSRCLYPGRRSEARNLRGEQHEAGDKRTHLFRNPVCSRLWCWQR